MGCLYRLKYHCIFLLFIILCVSGCKSASLPELLQVDALSEALVEAGTQLEIKGRGFPEKRMVLLHFKGSVYSPGRQPRDLSLKFKSRSSSVATVHYSVAAADMRKFLGAAEHGTFRGLLELSFPSQETGGATLRGSHLVVFDLISSSEISLAANDESQRFLNFLGIELDSNLQVQSVTPGSLGQQIGLAIEDQIIGLDEVHVLFFSDLIPRPNAQVSQVQVLSAQPTEARQIPFQRAAFITHDIKTAGGSLLILTLLLLLCFVATRPPSLLRLFSYQQEEWKAGGLGFLRDSWVVFGAFSCFLVFLIFCDALRELALPLWVGLHFFVLLFCAFMKGARRVRGGLRLLNGLGEALRQLLVLLPLSAAIALAAVEQGALSFADFRVIQSAEGSYFLSSPWACALAIAFFMSLIPVQGVKPPAGLHSTPSISALSDPLVASADLSRGALLYLGVLLYCGRPELDKVWSLSLFLFTLQCGGASLLFVFLRSRLGHLSLRASMRLIVLPNSVLALGALLAFFLFSMIRDLQIYLELLAQTTGIIAAALALLLIISYFRSLNHWGRKTDPWL